VAGRELRDGEDGGVGFFYEKTKRGLDRKWAVVLSYTQGLFIGVGSGGPGDGVVVGQMYPAFGSSSAFLFALFGGPDESRAGGIGDTEGGMRYPRLNPEQGASLGVLETPLGGQETSLDGQETSLDGQETSLDGQGTSLDGQETSLGGKGTSLDGQETSLGGQETSLDGQETSLGGQETSLDGQETSLDGPGTSLGGPEKCP